MASLSKLPPYGKNLAHRQRFNNLPFMVIICVGVNAWQSAKAWNMQPDVSALVLTPEQIPSALQWPVKSCFCVIDWGIGAAETLVIQLAKCLLRSGAVSVTVRPLWVGYSTPPGFYQQTGNGLTWIATRETIKTYQPRKVQHVA
jgi:hypothetical protein